MNDEQLQECNMHRRELGCTSLELPFHQATFPHIISTKIANAGHNLIPATASCCHVFTLCIEFLQVPTMKDYCPYSYRNGQEINLNVAFQKEILMNIRILP